MVESRVSGGAISPLVEASEDITSPIIIIAQEDFNFPFLLGIDVTIRTL
jgi:hypothetical protein